MIKVAVAIFSTYWGRSFKSKQIQELVIVFEKKHIEYTCFSLDFSLKYVFTTKISNIRVSSFPLLIYKFYEKFKLRFIYDAYWNYLLSEYLYFWIFKRAIIKDDAEIIICKNRPSQLLNYIKKKSNKKIILEVDQLHPLYTQNIVSSELDRLKLSTRSIYTDNFAVNNYIKSFDLADCIVVYSEYQKNNLISNGIEKPVFINELGTDLAEFEKSNFNPENEIAFVCFANHSILKGSHLLIDSWVNGKIKSKLFIVGSQEVDFKELKNRYLCLPESIVFIESFTIRDLKLLSEKFNLVGMLNSLSEGYSRVVNEYLALGLPVILSKVNFRPNIDGICGYIIDSFDEDGIISAVYKLICKEKYIEFQKNIKSRVFRSYSDFANTYLQIIESLC